MSTTFAIEVGDKQIEVARRRGIGNGEVAIIWLNDLVEILPDGTSVIPTDNTAQGVETLGDLRYLHIHHKLKNNE
jgi:hypothetical protein